MIFNNPEFNILFTTVISYFLACIIKLIIRLYNKRPVSFKHAFGYGGMPSSHTATIVSLSMAILLHEGMNTTFILSAVISAIVMADAFGVRYQTGQQAKLLNKIMIKNKIFKKKYNEYIGHTVKQVFFGALLGIIVAIITYVY